ncbi:MAG: MarR family transcriptional regulator [Gammaproteobacteria bacterium]|nr:MarR family transcriptional regulator [Gammaproteobacteria bacterium]
MVDQNNQNSLNAALELFHFAFRAFTSGPDAILAEHGLQRVHHRILYFVGRNPAISVNALLKILGVSKQALNGPLRALKELDLIDAKPDEFDKRIKRLTLSEQGQALENRLSQSQRELMTQVFADAGEDAEQHWRAIMLKLAETKFAHLLNQDNSDKAGEGWSAEC